LPRDVATQAGRLLRVLFLRLGQVPTDPVRRELLCDMIVRPPEKLETQNAGTLSVAAAIPAVPAAGHNDVAALPAQWCTGLFQFWREKR
jgi:hypothetical protein